MRREILIPVIVGAAGCIVSVALGVSLGSRDVISAGAMISVAVMATLGALMEPRHSSKR